MAQLGLACQQRLTLWGAAEDAGRSPELLKEAQTSLRLLSGEFSAERFQHMKAQASSMCHSRGLAVWGEALEASQEARRILEDTLAKCKEALEGGPPCGPAPDWGRPVSREDALCAEAQTAEGEALPERYRPVGEGGSSFAAVPPLADPACRRGRAASLETVLQAGALEAEHLCKETPGLLHPPPQPAPTDASCPRASPGPGAPETPTCTSLPARGPRGRKKEAAQYFQLSRQGSFSSEDADSQTSAEDSLSGSATLPMDSTGPQAACSLDKSRGIVYLENHSPSRAGAAPTPADP